MMHGPINIRHCFIFGSSCLILEAGYPTKIFIGVLTLIEEVGERVRFEVFRSSFIEHSDVLGCHTVLLGVLLLDILQNAGNPVPPDHIPDMNPQVSGWYIKLADACFVLHPLKFCIC
jgi:hypothetical protein